MSKKRTQAKSSMRQTNQARQRKQRQTSTLDVPLVMTSWGKLQRFDSFNAAQASAFIKANRNHVPEPNAP